MGGARKTRAVVLLSGGLDSTLAAKVLLEQGVEVLGLHCSIGFAPPPHRHKVGGVERDPLRAARSLGIPIEELDLTREFLDVLSNPHYGYGSRVNPCIDCKILMVNRARHYMAERGADLVATGEVLGQRPMSQHRGSLNAVENHSGLKGRLLRPLCALRLPETDVEREGLVDRSRLLGITGRGRRPQMDLMSRFGLEDYPAPAGGCLLTDPSFARRLKDKMAHLRGEPLTSEAIELLKVGRHLRLREDLKLIVGRNEPDNDRIVELRGGRRLLEALGVSGPVAVLDEGVPTTGEERLCAAITARYSDGKGLPEVEVRAEGGGIPPQDHRVAPHSDEGALRALLL